VHKRLSSVFTTWPFFLGLLALLVNDAWLKQAWPGILTGKLSDFAGIAIVTLLLLAIQPHRPRLMIGLIVAGFTWWKSALSQPAIDAVNQYLSQPIGRVVDYTDLVAFLVIPVCAIVASRPNDFALPGRSLRRIAVVPIAVMTMLGIMATSQIPGLRETYQIRAPAGAAEFNRSEVVRIIEEVATRYGLKCQDCTNQNERGWYGNDDISLVYTFVDGNAVSFQLAASRREHTFGPSAAEHARRLRDELKSRLASTRMDLEYVEQLGPVR
jgi:hypothetical protein